MLRGDIFSSLFLFLERWVPLWNVCSDSISLKEWEGQRNKAESERGRGVCQYRYIPILSSQWTRKTVIALARSYIFNKPCPQQEGKAEWQRQSINYRLNKLSCYSARPLQSEATAEGSFCQRWSSWGGCNVGTDSKEQFSESFFVFSMPNARMFSVVISCFAELENVLNPFIF